MAELVSAKGRLLMQTLLTDTHIAEKIFENSKDKEKYKICTIQENGTVVLGKTSFTWWNRFLNCQDELPFESFALKVWDALVDNSSGLNNKAIIEGLSREIVVNAVRNKNYNWTIDRLYDCWAHVAQLGEGYQKAVSSEDGREERLQDRGTVIKAKSNDEHNIILNIGGNKKVIPIKDSVGDPINLGIEVGIVGVRNLY